LKIVLLLTDDKPVSYDISLAAAEDLDSVAALLQANAPSNGGALTGEFPREKVEKMLHNGMPVVVARKEGHVVGVLFSSAKDNPAPAVRAMLAAWPGDVHAYVYGPACISDSERGQGLLAKLYTALQQHCAGREAVLFIQQGNVASIRAHERLGMRAVAEYVFEGQNYLVFTNRH
jgi:L-amino acid N-acyltransferase YncA